MQIANLVSIFLEHETKEIPVVSPLAPQLIRRANFAIIRHDQIAKMKPVPFICKLSIEFAVDENRLMKS